LLSQETETFSTNTAAIQLAPPALASIHDFAAIDAWRRERRLDPEHVRRLRLALYKRHQGVAGVCAALPLADRDDFRSRFDFHALALESRHDSSQDGATKLIFRTRQNLLLETVILRVASGRTALCVSTQVGCAAKCDFCATGRMGIARNLTIAEILDQLVQANLLLAEEHRSVRNVVFMGMGEPFHNEDALHAAIEVLTDPRASDLSLSRIMVSTVGIPAAMIRAARRWPQMRLAVSLHSARPEVRRQLMPISERHELTSLRAALAEVAALQRHSIMIEYLLLDGLTDTDEDLRVLAAYLGDLPVHINLIPFNPIDAAPHLAATSPERQAEFSQSLKAAGFTVTTRRSLGGDIAAACGQLVRAEHRRRALA
jgi:23S rRNA (adenine2503-C2)-methyltransferase